MPLYSYICMQCNNNFEEITGINERDTVVCNECGATAERQIDRPGMVWSPTRNGGYSV